MILTVTPNPSVDLLFEADALVWDDANRVAMPRRRAGGQGINVARAVAELGGEAVAVAPLGGAAGDELRVMLAAERLPLVHVPISGETRVFAGVREASTGRSLLLNPRGPVLDAAESEALAVAVAAAIREHRPDWVLTCGSLPPGLEPDFHARVGDAARACGARFVPDCDGEPLRLAASAGCDLLVPNLHEAARLLGRPLDDAGAGVGGPAGAAAGAAADLLGFGPAVAAVTLGAAGAVLATPDGVWHAEPPAVSGSGSAVGAGDAFLAALVLHLRTHDDPAGALRAAVAAGTAVLVARGDRLLRRSDASSLLDGVVVRRVR